MNMAVLLSRDDDDGERYNDDDSERDEEARAGATGAGDMELDGDDDDEETPSPTTTTSSASSNDRERDLLEKKNRHRLSNMRHRKRKNLEIDGLRRRARDLEAKRDQLQAASSSIAASEGPWEELCEIERGKLALAREEHSVLQRSVLRHENIIQRFYNSKYPGPHDPPPPPAEE
ncbi:hypothetical protein ACHHYP_12002 [Achlya hypogyna]|uniref:BZIP domain-containing protein n=1 Tax=Achlya hypogyna TaxID=1202772 RepID=A0A1V9YHT4_ACHHY|nr:hypothetical protein ACHHYP_12002 [Achlya hypogyna]